MTIQNLKNIHKNERAFIIGNGPSLADTPLEELKNECTLATNKIFKIFNKTSWRPKYYVLSKTSNEVTKKNINRMENTGTTCLINTSQFQSRNSEKHLPLNVIKPYKDYRKDCFGDLNISNKSREYWSDDIADSVYLYNSSIYPLFQLANYLGVDKIYLLGCDLGMDGDLDYFSKTADPYEYLRNNQIHPSESFSLKIYKDFINKSNRPMIALLNMLYAKSLYIGSMKEKNTLFKSGSDPIDFKIRNEGEYDSKLRMYYEFLEGSDKQILSFINGCYAMVSAHTPIGITDIRHKFGAYDPHFTDDYRSGNRFIIGEDDRQRRAHKLAYEKLEQRGVKVENATLGGELEIYPRAHLGSILN